MSARKRASKPSMAPTKKRADDPLWSWVLTEVSDASQISEHHITSAYGFAARNAAWKPVCANKLQKGAVKKTAPKVSSKPRVSEAAQLPAIDDCGDEEELLVVSDNDIDSPKASCSKKSCASNPNCVNYIGQSKLEDEESAWSSFVSSVPLGDDPTPRLRDLDRRQPVGLTNLGATCYCNAFLQVWFRNKAFLRALMAFESDPQKAKSPIYQLQLTFAAMQYGRENVFNPTRLIESLGLNPFEQQDAQEFSKLFMSLIRDEFKKSTNPDISAIIDNQFEGSQIYGVACKRCGKRSERSTAFLELEVSLQSSGDLDSNIRTLLQTEELTGDNKYFCEACNSLQDATRYTQITKLPPVLHFAIMRFHYDFQTDSRKKKNFNISFPRVLDMSLYVTGSAEQGNHDNTDVYELQGILRHKGTSAYQGHYEAQVYDTDHGGWLLFNDETVTNVQPTASRASKNGKKTLSKNEVNVDVIGAGTPPRAQDNELFESKDAYMLVYSKAPHGAVQTHSPEPLPSTSVAGSEGRVQQIESIRAPNHIFAEVERLDGQFSAQLAAYDSRKEYLRNRFNCHRAERLELCAMWSIQNHTERSAVVHIWALERWLSRRVRFELPAPPTTESSLPNIQQPTSDPLAFIDSVSNTLNPSLGVSLLSTNPEQESGGESEAEVKEAAIDEDEDPLSNMQLACAHGKLDPLKFASMKRVSMAGYEQWISLLGEDRIYPEFYSDDTCRQCVVNIFSKKMYAIEHPEKVREFDAANDQSRDGDIGVWISKPWLKDWRRTVPSFHRADGDPPPDAAPWRTHVLCEHGQLNVDTSERVLITSEASSILSELFPNWVYIDSSAGGPCTSCSQEASLSQEMRQNALEQKAALRGFGNPLNPFQFIPGASYAILPSSFLVQWKTWVAKPLSAARPERVDNSFLLCEHGLLLIDPMVNEDFRDDAIYLTEEKYWRVIAARYEVSEALILNVSEVQFQRVVLANKETCVPCRTARKRIWTRTRLTIEKLRPEDTPPTVATATATDAQVPEPGANPGPVDLPMEPANGPEGERLKTGGKRPNPSTYAGSEGERRSKRIRGVKLQGLATLDLTVAHTDSVMDLKQQITDRTGIVPIQQHLYLHGVELIENSATMEQLGVLAFDTLMVQAPNENEAAHDDDRGDGEGFKAFGGSLLVGNVQAHPANDTRSVNAMPPQRSAGQEPIHLDCPACTFSNTPDAERCAMCDTLL